MTQQSAITMLSSAAKNIAAGAVFELAEFDPLTAALSAARVAYRQRMAVVMAGLVAAGSSEEHLEWLADAERCLAQFELVSAWIGRQTGIASSQSAQSSAA